MRHLLLSTALILGASACTGDDETPSERLVDPFTQISSDETCETYITSDGKVCDEIEGATVYFVAEMTFNDDEGQTISGAWWWTFYGNPAWRATTDWENSRAGANGDEYCTIGVSLSGTWTEGSEVCGACAKGVSYNTTFDASRTTCPDALVNVEKDRVDGVQGATWGVEMLDDGTAKGWDTQRMWADSGEHDDDSVVLWGKSGCSWFGGDECT